MVNGKVFPSFFFVNEEKRTERKVIWNRTEDKSISDVKDQRWPKQSGVLNLRSGGPYCLKWSQIRPLLSIESHFSVLVMKMLIKCIKMEKHKNSDLILRCLAVQCAS